MSAVLEATIVSARLVGARVSPSGNRDRLIGFAAAVLLHAAVFALGGAALVEAPRYGVETGGGIEVDLVAAPRAPEPEAEAPPVPAPAEKPVASLEAAASFQAPAPIVPAKVTGDGSSPVPGEDASTLRSSAGAKTTAKPHYLRNRPPAYPEASRRAGEEGVVLLGVVVGADGKAHAVEVRQSSSFDRLDRAAEKAVRAWRFEPARVGALAVEARVEVPIRFTLKENP